MSIKESAKAPKESAKASDRSGKTVALALGSGGARGYAHIGVLDALHERGYRIVGVSGCSMGAVVGGFYCAGKLDTFRDWVGSLGYLDVLRLVDVSLASGGVIRGDRVFSVINEMLGDQTIEALEIPFTAIATDMSCNREVWFQSGSLETAIRASSAIPSVFNPVMRGSQVLVDGGVLNPLPISPCVSLHADLIMAVDLNSNLPMPENFQFTSSEACRKQPDWLDEAIDKASSWLDSKKESSVRQEVGVNLGKFEMINRMFEVMQGSLTRLKTAAYPPDLLVNLPVTSCEMYEFYRAKEMIALGHHVATMALDAWEQGRSSPYGQRMI